VAGVLVTFTPPVFHDGGFPVNQYRAKCESTDGGVTHRERRRWMARTINVRHLTPGKTYRCTVTARNASGYGPFSAPSDTVVTLAPPTAPAPPTITSVTAVPRGVTIAFTKPADDGGARVVGYRVECAAANGNDEISRSPRRSPFTVDGMAAGVTYTCTVAARNASGLGAASAPSDPFVPLAPDPSPAATG
jgi:large repetitive protein